jgi:PAS domain-containing protein
VPINQGGGGIEKEPSLYRIPAFGLAGTSFFNDAKGRYQGCNPAFAQMMGVTSENMHSKTVHQLWPGAQAEVYHQKDLELMQLPVRRAQALP